MARTMSYCSLEASVSRRSNERRAFLDSQAIKCYHTVEICNVGQISYWSVVCVCTVGGRRECFSDGELAAEGLISTLVHIPRTTISVTFTEIKCGASHPRKSTDVGPKLQKNNCWGGNFDTVLMYRCCLAEEEGSRGFPLFENRGF